MSKVIKILVVVVIVLAGVVVWVKNPGDIQSKILRTKFQAEKAAKDMAKAGKVTPEGIEKGKQCRDMLERIMRAKRAAEERKGVAGVSHTWEEVLPFLNMKEIPRCPSGGQYSLNPPLQVPSCSIGNNRTIDTADDHIVYH
jgi:hypothetical protein